MFSFLNFRKTSPKQSLILMSPSSLPVHAVFSEVEPEYADTFRTFTVGKRAVTLSLYRNGKIRRFLSSSKKVKEKCGREATYRYSEEMEPLSNMSLDVAAAQTRRELKNMSRKDNIELRQTVKPAKVTSVAETPEPAITTTPADNNSVNSTHSTPAPVATFVGDKVMDQKKLKGQGRLLSFGISDQTRKIKGTNEVEKYSCFCVDIEDKDSKATERLLGADLERALTESKAKVGDQVEVYLMAVKQMTKERSKNFYEIRIIK